MTDSSATGRFWLCPQCQRHVPIRTDVCQCGLDRTKLPVRVREVGGLRPAPEKPRGSGGLVAALAVVLACGALLYLGVRGFMTQEGGGPQGFRKLRLRGQDPQVVYVPVPVASSEATPPQPPSGETTPSADGDGGAQKADPSLDPRAVESAEPPAGLLGAAATPAPQVPPTPEASTLSETDVRRAAGAAQFEREVQVLSAKADQADIAWRRYVEGCRLEVTQVEAGAAVGGRTWFAAAWASSTTTRQTDACAEAGTFFALTDQVRRGMCGAEDRARHASVYPGTRRDLRSRYRMDWDGWDRICS